MDMHGWGMTRIYYDIRHAHAACMHEWDGIGLVGLVILCSFSPPPLGSSV